MNNEVYITNLKNFEPESKAMIAAISNVEILHSISNESNSKPIIFFISKKKIFIFKKDSKEVITEVYSFDKIVSLLNEQKTRRRGSLVLTLDNGKKYIIEDIKKDKISDFTDEYEKLLTDFEKSNDNELLKNISSIEDYSDSDLLKNIKNIEKITDDLPSPIKKPNENKNIANFNNNNNKSKRIVDDSTIGDDTTFSSKYIYSLLSKKNTLLPDGKLSNIDKINSKIDDIDINNHKFNPSSNEKADKDFIKDIKSALLKINEKVNLLKENIEDTITKRDSTTESKINEVAANSVDSKEILKVKHSLEITKNTIEKDLKDFVKETNEKMSKISNSLISNDVLDKIDKKISDSKKEITTEVEKVKNSFREKMYFLNEVADRQISISKDLKKYSNANEGFNDEIFHVQNAWLENNKKFSIYDDKLLKLEENWKNQTESINNVIKKLKERSGENSNVPIEKSSIDNEWFLDSTHNTTNKLLAVNSKGEGIYFDVEEFKNDIDKLISQSKNELVIMMDEKIHDIKKFLISNIEEINNQKEEKIIEEITPKKDFKTTIFKGKSYIHNGIERHGIRSGQTLSLRMEKNSPGIDSLYFADDSKEPLYINKYDGIIFANKKYYINTPKEFNNSKKDFFKMVHIEYEEGIKPYRLFEIVIQNDLIEYKAFNEKGHLISDKDPLSIKYDLKWLTLFKE